MIKDTHNKKRGAYGAIMGLAFLSFLIFGLFFTFPVKKAQAVDWTDYYDVLLFSGDLADDSAFMSIYVKTSFSIIHKRRPAQSFCVPSTNYSADKFHFTINDNEVDTLSVIDVFSIRENGILKYYGGAFCWNSGTYYAQFDAGSTYDFKLTKNRSTDGSNLLGFWSRTYYNTMPKGWFYLDSSDYITKLFYDSPSTFLYNSNIYYYTELPVLNISFPLNNAEIADAFYIQGTYTIPDASNYNKLTAYVGRGIPYYQYNFTQELTEKTGNVNIRVSGVLEGVYYIEFVFSGDGEVSYFSESDTIENINIVKSIPVELPDTQELPPDVFSTLLPEYIYGEYSNYATSTELFSALTGAIKPLIFVIGDNLTFFSSQFNQDNAKDAGEKAGNAVLLVRSYTGNINSFFNDMPVSEILFLYLSALIAVIVFRIIRLLLKLIPFT